ncbi:MAG: peptidoglycan-binding protein [Stellaceae bacterium]
MTINVDDVLNRISPITARSLKNYTDAIRQGGQLFEKAGITTPLRMAHFLAQALHETGRFTVLRENMNYSEEQLTKIFGVGRHSAAVNHDEAFDLAHHPERIAERVYGTGNPHKAQELGNTEPGDGFRYRGNGILQMTGRGAHRRIGQACGVNFESHPELATTPEHALKPALQEWTEGSCNELADKNNIRAITLKINGGFNGLPERRVLFNRVLSLLEPGADPDMVGAADDDIKSLQQNLNILVPRKPPLDVDGHFGPNTERAVREFQAAAGIVADGIPGPVTLASIRLKLDAVRAG